MDTLFLRDGIDFLRWIDNEGNTWEAEYEFVKLFGKEAFEKMLTEGFDIEIGSWEVTFNDDEIYELPETKDEDYEYIDSWYEYGI